MPDTAHTPTPWHTSLGQDVWAADCKVAETHTLNQSSVYCETSKAERRANAEFIVRAVNSHDALLAALKAARPCIIGYIDRCDFTKGHEVLSIIDAAISAATPKD